ncbi:MAG: discoidin domain-containing protein [Bacteroidetes bacterium]|nr:discoidin domain-containing protein [Bacteroidota bacterium]
MNKIGLVLVCVLLAQLCGRGQSLRQRMNFNGDWRFRLGDPPGAEAADYDDGGWERVGLPHSFSMPYFGASQFYTGWGWYRKHFAMPADWRGRRWSLEFEAAFQDAEVFVNGVSAGRHQGGYTGFSLDITREVRAGDNVVAVRLNNLWNPRLAPRAGEHVFSGGIYRDVYLVGTGPVRVGWCGSFVTTPEVSAARAVVRVRTEIVNGLDSSCRVEARTMVRDMRGAEVARWVGERRLGPGETGRIDQGGVLRGAPRLWSPDRPYRYHATTELWVGGRKVDEYSTLFGIRSIRWTADSGFFLNGKHLYLRGANVHQDHAGWGDAVTNAGFYRDVRMMKEAGFNFIRGSHYPHDPAFYDACDSLGMVVWSENTFWGIGAADNTPEGYWTSSAYPTVAADQAPFEECVGRELREMIRIQRNHPCVVVWSMSNEPFFTARSVMRQTRELLKKLVGIAHECDPTRPAAIGGAQRPLDSNRIDLLGDMAGYNGDGGAIPLFQDPGVPNVVTEYGSLATKRPGQYVPNWGDLARDSGKAVHPWRAGQAIWCGFDHGSIAGPQMGEMGLVDYFRLPKRSWYWYRDHYRHIPPPVWPGPGIAAGLRLSADKRRAMADGTDDIQLVVTVVDARGVAISNSPQVRMEIESGPGELPTGRSIEFTPGGDISILDGQAAIECRAWYSGRSRIRVSSPGLRPAVMDVDFDGPVAYVAGVTPLVSARPYVRFVAAQADTVSRSLGRNNPTFASSAAEWHSSGLAADGDTASYWQPLAGDSAAWWSLDMEKQVKVDRILIEFGGGAGGEYTVEVGGKEGWRKVGSGRGQETGKVIEVEGVAGKQVRLRWASSAGVRLAEVKVVGRIISTD